MLRQLRSGYDQRPAAFPHSIILCGVRDVRDYRIHSTAEDRLVLGGSAFNIKSESLRLGNFSEHEIRALLAQHTAATGQAFTEDALALIRTRTGGQPWLVNALCYDACFRNLPRSLLHLRRTRAPVGRSDPQRCHGPPCGDRARSGTWRRRPRGARPVRWIGIVDSRCIMIRLLAMLGLILRKAILERLGLVVWVHYILRNVEVSEGYAQGASYGEHAAVVAGKLNGLPSAPEELERRQMQRIQGPRGHWKGVQGAREHRRRQLQQGDTPDELASRLSV